MFFFLSLKKSTLNESAGLVLPVLTLGGGDGGEVLNVRRRLGLGVVEVAAETEEGESLLNELTDTLVAEEEDAKDDVVLLGGGDELLGGLVELLGEVHLREHVATVVEAHGHAEVVLTKEGDIDALHGHDLLEVLNARRGLDLEGDNHVLVGLGHVAEETLGVHALLRSVDGAGSLGGVEAARDGLLELLGVVDVGDEDTIRTAVEGVLDARAVLGAANANHDAGGSAADRRHHTSEGEGVHGGVLGIDEEPVITAVTELAGHKGGGRVQEHTKLGVTGAKLGLEFSGTSGHDDI
ncbi:2,4-dihydroxyhept-2-ene-1,7-dioic acid aldolase [Angomonas deanei]|nr:2,4-dihydroxyhept-2-ene-1,7-dioic acid aldolase [Angomonas deanei]|eukprot:EPY42494.1 2,4-dihydroxyhept-2-ene-1,7-dioic acid aldolase [Angomonas deanei]